MFTKIIKTSKGTFSSDVEEILDYAQLPYRHQETNEQVRYYGTTSSSAENSAVGMGDKLGVLRRLLPVLRPL
jgi:hypothetical protein